MNVEMTEDDEAKQRAHEVANQSQSLYATGSPTNHSNDKSRGQISKHSPVIETTERKVDDEADHERTITANDRDADDHQEETRSESIKEVENPSQNAAQDQHERELTDRSNHDQQSNASSRQNRRYQHTHNIHHHNNNNNINTSSPSNHQRKHNQQYTPAAVMGQEGTVTAAAAVAGPSVSADYLAQLIKDKKQLAAFPTNVFLHAPRLIEDEIQRVRQQLFQHTDVVSLHQQHLELPEPDGEFVSLQEKIYVPVDQHPEYNFVGRLLGPRGMTAKQLEQETGCKIMIRGKGSMRDKKKEEQNRGKANWEHLNDDLHVLITVEDTQSRAQIKLGRAIQEVRQLLVPVVDGEDELKKRQLMELAIINGTYRDCNYNEALSKMLTDAAYRQSQLVEHGSPTNSGQQQSMAVAAATASASSSGSPPSGPLAASRHFLTHLQHYPSSTTASSNLDGSSGFPSTGSTPNSLHHSASHQQVVTSSPHNRHQSHPHHGLPQTHHHHHPGSPHHLSHPTNVAVVAAAAAAAAAQQHQQTPGLTQSGTNHHHPHHPHSHQSPAAAAAAAAAALMSNPAAEASAILYAQQYHDFQHYAAMAAAAAASHQSILPPPPPLDYNSHHPHHAYPPPHHPHPHHHHAVVAQAVAAAAAANQQFHRQIAEQQHQQHNAEALANTHEMVNYHQQDQQIDNGNNQNDFQNLPLDEESSGVTSEQSSDQQQQKLQQEQDANQ